MNMRHESLLSQCSVFMLDRGSVFAFLISSFFPFSFVSVKAAAHEKKKR